MSAKELKELRDRVKELQERIDIAFAGLAILVRDRDAAQAALADLGSGLHTVLSQLRETRKLASTLQDKQLSQKGQDNGKSTTQVG